MPERKIFAWGRPGLHVGVQIPPGWGVFIEALKERKDNAMQKTEHYGLNLWELSDRIMMEDFNADNAKLDAALHALAAGGGGADLLGDTCSEVNPAWSIGTAFWGWDEPTHWDQYSIVLFMGNVTKTDADAIPYTALYASSDFRAAPAENTKFTFEPGGFLYVLTPMKDPQRMVEGFFISGGKAASFRGTAPFESIMRYEMGGETAAGNSASVMIKNYRVIGIR